MKTSADSAGDVGSDRASNSGGSAPAPPGATDHPRVDWLEDVAYDWMVLGLARNNSDSVEIVEVVMRSGPACVPARTLLGFYSSLLFVWRTMKTPLMLDSGACECVGSERLMPGDTRRFILHGADLGDNEVAFIVISQPGRWNVEKVKNTLISASPHFSKEVRRGETPASLSSSRFASLTPREQDVLRLLVNGASNKLIACELGISCNTVRNLIQTMFRKTGANNRTQLAFFRHDNS